MEPSTGSDRIEAVEEDVRVQYRLDVREGPTGVGDDADTRTGIVADVVTTARNASLGSIIELALRRFRFDRTGVITHVDRAYRWREDPGTPIPPEIAAITGLTDEDVAGRRIDDQEAVRLLRSASVVIAHNAAFDRPAIERRLEGVDGLAWACTMTQIDWMARGFDGQALGYLLRQVGWFHDVRRAEAHVDAVVQLLRHRFPDDRTALTVLIKTAFRPSWIVRAVGAAFEVKDALKERGYRWDADRRIWWREVTDDERTPEAFWLAANVYTVPAGAKATGPEFEEITASTRFSSNRVSVCRSRG